MDTMTLTNQNIRFLSFKLWFLNRPFKQASNSFDADWINVLFLYQNNQITYEDQGSILTLTGLKRFLKEVEALYKNLNGKAELSSYEPNIYILLEAKNLGHIECTFKFEKDYKIKLEIHDECDQTFLPNLIDEIKESIRLLEF